MEIRINTGSVFVSWLLIAYISDGEKKKVDICSTPEASMPRQANPDVICPGHRQLFLL